MNNNGTLLSHLLSIVSWQFSNVKKVSKNIYTFEWLRNILLQLFQIKLFPNNKMGWNGECYLPPPVSMVGGGWGGLPLHWPGRGHRSGTLADHLWMSRSSDSPGRWQEGIGLVIPHQHPVKFPGFQVPSLLLLGAVGVQDGTTFCFSCFPHKTDLFGYVFAHSWIKWGLFNSEVVIGLWPQVELFF